MKIKFLGTAAGIPEKERECTSIMIEVGESLYIFDCGASVTHKLCDSGFSPDKIKAVFITHSHLDHMYGLADIFRVVNKRGKQSASVDYYFPEENTKRAWVKYFSDSCTALNESLNILHVFERGGMIFSDENIRVTAIPTAHMKKLNRPSYAFLIEADEKKILYSGDLSQELSKGDFPDIVKREPIDLFILEYAHFDVEDMLPHLEECIAKRMYFTHISRFNEKLPLIKALANSGKFAFPINAACDGEEIEI